MPKENEPKEKAPVTCPPAADTLCSSKQPGAAELVRIADSDSPRAYLAVSAVLGYVKWVRISPFKGQIKAISFGRGYSTIYEIAQFVPIGIAESFQCYS